MARNNRGLDDFGDWFPLTYSNTLTDETELYEDPSTLWSDYEHFDSREELKPEESFVNRLGRPVEFKTTVWGFIEFIRFA